MLNFGDVSVGKKQLWLLKRIQPPQKKINSVFSRLLKVGFHSIKGQTAEEVGFFGGLLKGRATGDNTKNKK